MSITISQLVVRANEAMRLAHAQLEVEDGGREVAKLQGNIAGHKNFIEDLSAEFGLTQFFLDDTGDTSLVLSDLEEAQLEEIQADINLLKKSSSWVATLARIDVRTQEMKDFLLERADKSRSLDICQGKHQAHIAYQAFFNAVESALLTARQRSAEKKSELPFDDDDEDSESEE